MPKFLPELCYASANESLAPKASIMSEPCPWWSAPALRELRRWVKWAVGAGRREGVHMVHTFEEICTCTPASPNEAAPEAAMPQAAWEALLRDAVQGLRPPPTPPKPSAGGSRSTTPRQNERCRNPASL